MACSYTDESFSSSMSMQSNNNNHYTLPLLPSDSFLGLQLTDYLENQQQQKDSPPHSLSITNTTPTKCSPSPPTTSTATLQGHNQTGDTSLDDDSAPASPLLWVPADRHPEIAPSEFAHWLETNGSNNVARKTSLRRKSSVLSNIHIPLEEGEPTTDTSSLPPPSPPTHQPSTSSSPSNQSADQQQQGTPLGFDRHSSAQDTSRVLAPRGNRSLLRRSAFSARGRGRKQTGSRHGQHNDSDRRNEAETTTLFSGNKEDKRSLVSAGNNKPTMEPVRLYDRPVSMSEWIDLGSASLVSASDDSQHGILSRVHDAESNLLSQYDTTSQASLATVNVDGIQGKEVQDEATALSPPSLPTINETTITAASSDHHHRYNQEQHSIPSVTSDTPPTKDLDIMENSSSLDEVTLPPPLNTATKKASSRIQRATSERLPSKQERKSNSWFGGLFGDKDKKRGSLRRVEDERQAQQQRYGDEKQQQNNTGSTTTAMDTTTASNNNRKSGIGSLFSRSKSEHKTNNKRHHQKLQQHVIPGVSQSNQTLGMANASGLRQHQHHYGDEMALHGYRLPIHVERAIYRLSHFKLADPRRPLHHQVAISNLMFWYLGVINAQQQQHQQHQQQQQQQTNPPPSSSYTTAISTTTTTQQQQQPSVSSNTNTAYFDETATQLSPHDQKGPKTGRIGIPKSRLNSNNSSSKGSLTTGVTSQEQPYRDNTNGLTSVGTGKNDDDDLPLSYYKQS